MNEINYWLHAMTPLHVGAGRGLGYIDMPIVREKVTTWPYVPGSSIRGAWRDGNYQRTRSSQTRTQVIISLVTLALVAGVLLLLQTG